MQEASLKTVIYISTNHPLVYRIIEKMLSSYCVKRFYRDLNAHSSCNWILIVDSYSVAEWLAITAHCGIQQRRPVLILADASKTREEELRLVYLGTRGIVPMSNFENDLSRAVDAVMEGHLWLPRDTLREHLMRTDCSNACSFSVREEQVLAFLVNGSSNKEISGALGISDRTVKFHVSNILRKFKVKNRKELMKSKQAAEECWPAAV
jgi:two-component system, NarL family, nitrate/nitrite response regulator NarL